MYCCKLDDFRINHHEAQLIRREAVEQRGDDGIDANGFAGTGAAGDEAVRHFREVGDDGMAVNVLAERDGNARLGIAPFVRLEQIAHDDFRLDGIRHFDADGTFSRHGREDVDALGLERGGDVVGERGDFFQLHAGRGMQFVARDGRAFGDVAERNLDVELRERLLHEPRVGHQFLLRLGRLDGHVRVLEKIHRRQLIIADHRRLRDGDGLGFARQAASGRRDSGNFDFRLGFFLAGFFSFNFFGNGRFSFIFNDFFFVWFFAENMLGRGGDDFLGGNHFAFIGGRGLDGDFRFGQSGFAEARAGRRFGLRHAQVAHGRFRHGQSVRAEAAGGFPGFFGLAICSSSRRLCFSRSRARFSRAISSGDFCPVSPAADFFSNKARIHSPSWKLVRKSRLIRQSAE